MNNLSATRDLIETAIDINSELGYLQNVIKFYPEVQKYVDLDRLQNLNKSWRERFDNYIESNRTGGAV